MNIKVSVIVVTYNHGPWLAECLESILGQNVSFPIEILVGDDASTDGLTQSVLMHFAHRHPSIITPVLRESNIGFDRNELDLLNRSTGAYIARIDGDDLMLPNKLQIQSDFLDKHQSFAAVSHRMARHGQPIATRNGASEFRSLSTQDFLSEGCIIYNSSKMFRRSCVSIFERFGVNPVVDYCIHLDHTLHGNIACLPDILGVYRPSVGISSNPLFAISIANAYNDAFSFVARRGYNPRATEIARMRYLGKAVVRAILDNNSSLFKHVTHLLVQHQSNKLELRHRIPFAIARTLGLSAASAVIKMHIWIKCIVKFIFRESRPLQN